MSHYYECPLHGLYDSDQSCPQCDEEQDARIHNLETLIRDILEAIVPYRINQDGTTSSNIPDELMARINVLVPEKEDK